MKIRHLISIFSAVLFFLLPQTAIAAELDLPDSVKRIESEAFVGVDFDYIRFPETIENIENDVFNDTSFVAIITKDSYAKEWCMDHRVTYKQESAPSTILYFAENAENFAFSSLNGYEENPEYRMAHNIYSDPVLSATSGKFSAFSIDFQAQDVPLCTYWALCNWGMDVSSLSSYYTVTDSGGAYAGLQMTENGPMGIMSFWEIHYQDASGADRVLNARRVYPDGAESYFGGEGDGTNYIGEFGWESNHWYRMLLRCYDLEDGNTMVEQWVMDLDTAEWTLLSSFNTGLQHSFFVGSMSQFMENYYYEFSNEFRSFQYKNIWVKEYGTNIWWPLTQFWLSTDTWLDNKKGYYAFGASDSTLWGATCGFGPDIIKTKPNQTTSHIYSIPVGIMPTEPN